MVRLPVLSFPAGLEQPINSKEQIINIGRKILTTVFISNSFKKCLTDATLDRKPGQGHLYLG
jgi:hypothetical protein